MNSHSEKEGCSKSLDPELAFVISDGNKKRIKELLVNL